MVLLALTALAVLSRNGALCLQTRLILNTSDCWRRPRCWNESTRGSSGSRSIARLMPPIGTSCGSTYKTSTRILSACGRGWLNETSAISWKLTVVAGGRDDDSRYSGDVCAAQALGAQGRKNHAGQARARLREAVVAYCPDDEQLELDEEISW